MATSSTVSDPQQILKNGGYGLAILSSFATPILERAWTLGRRFPSRVVDVAMGTRTHATERLHGHHGGRVWYEATDWVALGRAISALHIAPDDVTVVYMFNPVIGETFTVAMERLLESVDRVPRRVRLLYNLPFEHNWLMGTGRFRAVAVAPNAWPARRDPTQVIVTYEVLPADAADPCGDPRFVGAWAGPNDLRAKLGPPYRDARPLPSRRARRFTRATHGHRRRRTGRI